MLYRPDITSRFIIYCKQRWQTLCLYILPNLDVVGISISTTNGVIINEQERGRAGGRDGGREGGRERETEGGRE